MPKIILISGKARRGKDTFSMYLKNEICLHGKRVLIIKYGDILKFICKEYFNWNGEKDEAGRTLLQHVGTDVVRAKEPNYWVNFARDFLKLFENEWDYVLIPDCRFPNELDWQDTDFFTFTIRLNRKNEDGSDFDNGLTPEQKAHSSETALDEYHFNYEIENKNLLDVDVKMQISM